MSGLMLRLMSRVSFRRLFSPPGNFLAFGFGSGLIPFAPGTWGSLTAIPMIILSAQGGLFVMSGVTLIACIWGVKLCGDAANSLGVHDHPAIVWDEIAGMMITMFLVPITWQTLTVGFILFRVLDIWKPFSIGWIDKNVHGGFGIMLDDIAAGAVAGVVLAIIYPLLIPV